MVGRGCPARELIIGSSRDKSASFWTACLVTLCVLRRYLKKNSRWLWCISIFLILYFLSTWNSFTLMLVGMAQLQIPLRHVSLRNVIGRMFGVLKERFRIFHSPPQYPKEIESNIIISACLFYNFITEHEGGNRWYGRRGRTTTCRC